MNENVKFNSALYEKVVACRKKANLPKPEKAPRSILVDHPLVGLSVVEVETSRTYKIEKVLRQNYGANAKILVVNMSDQLVEMPFMAEDDSDEYISKQIAYFNQNYFIVNANAERI